MKQPVTVKVKLPSDKRFTETMKVFSKAVQYCVNIAWKNKIYSNITLHKKVYYKLRVKFGLQAQLTCNAIKQAVEMVRKAKSKPTVNSFLSIRYNFPRCASVSKNWKTLSLSTVNGRVKFNIIIPSIFEKYLTWNIKESNLIRDYKGRFFFCFVFSREVGINTCRNGKIVGVDLGVNKLAVTSNNKFFGGSIKHKRVRWERKTSEIQAKGTPASRRLLKKRSGRWKRFMTWINHNISRKIVNNLFEGDVLVMEDLSYIRETAKYNKWVHKWAFGKLQKLLEYKAMLKGVRVVYISARNTSRECNRCHSTKTVRHGGFFECRNCGHTIDADLNGARNIAQRYMRNFGLGSSKSALDLACDADKATISA